MAYFYQVTNGCHRMRFCILLITCAASLLIQGCEHYFFPPAYYEHLKTKSFKRVEYAMSPFDTLWVLSPLTSVKIRDSYKRDSWNDELRAEEILEGKERVKVCVLSACRKYFSGRIKIMNAAPDERTRHLLEVETGEMFERMYQDSISSYKFSVRLSKSLLRNGIRRLLITNTYWEYMDKEFERKLTHYNNHGVKRPKNATVIVVQGVVYDAFLNDVILYRTVLETPGGIAKTPFGYFGNHDYKRSADQSFWINLAMQPIARKIRKIIKS